MRVPDLNLKHIVGIISFSKLLRVHRANYCQPEEITELFLHFALKHSRTQWATFKKVTVQIFEQWKIPTKYFLKFSFQANRV